MNAQQHTFRRRRRGGFTLIELVVALGMVAIVALSMYASVRAAFGARTSAEEALEPARSAALALDIVQNDLQNALARNGTLPQSFEATQSQDDRGHEADDVIFYSTADGPVHVDGTGEIKQIELTILDPSNSTMTDHVLARRVTSNLLSQVQQTPDDEVLCRGVSTFTVQYYTGSEWMATWDSTQEDNTLPAMVQVTLELERPVAGSSQMRTHRFTRIFPVSCSTAAQDSNVNTGIGL